MLYWCLGPDMYICTTVEHAPFGFSHMVVGPTGKYRFCWSRPSNGSAALRPASWKLFLRSPKYVLQGSPFACPRPFGMVSFQCGSMRLGRLPYGVWGPTCTCVAPQSMHPVGRPGIDDFGSRRPPPVGNPFPTGRPLCGPPIGRDFVAHLGVHSENQAVEDVSCGSAGVTGRA